MSKKEEHLQLLETIATKKIIPVDIIAITKWLIDNLEENNQPDLINVNNNGALLEYNNTTEQITINTFDIYYVNISNAIMKRYLVTPKGNLGDRDIFFLNKEMEFLRRQNKC